MSEPENPPTIQFECTEVTINANGQTCYHWTQANGCDIALGNEAIPFQALPQLYIRQPPSNPGGPISIIIGDQPPPPPGK